MNRCSLLVFIASLGMVTLSCCWFASSGHNASAEPEPKAKPVRYAKGKWVYRKPSRGSFLGTTFSRIVVGSNGERILVCRDQERAVFRFSAARSTGRIIEIGELTAGEVRDAPVDGAFCPKDRICILSNTRGQFLFFEKSADKSENEYAIRSTIVDGRVRQPKRIVANSSGSVLYATAEGSNQVCVISNPTTGAPVLVQCVGNTDDRQIIGTPSVFLKFPQGLALSDDRDLYVASFSNNSIVHFRADQTTGRLSFLRAYDATSFLGDQNFGRRYFMLPQSVAIVPSGRNVYVGGMNNVSVFSRHSITGKLTPQQFIGTAIRRQDPFYALRDVRSLRVSNDGSKLCACCAETGSLFLFSIADTGDLKLDVVFKDGTFGSPSLTNVSDAVFSTGGRYLFVTSNDLILGVLDLHARNGARKGDKSNY